MDDTVPVLHCDSLNLHTRTQTLLNNITFRINKGEIIGLIGSNGAGKSTLMKALIGLIPHVTGECRICGEDYRKPAARSHLTFLPEKFQIACALRGKDFLRIMNCGGSIEYLCQLFDFAPSWLNNPVKQYSKGMLQKLGLLYFFSRQRPLLLADELMSGLDMKTRAAVYSHLHTLRQQGYTVLFSTHMTYDLNELCDHVIELDKGSIQSISETTDLAHL